MEQEKFKKLVTGMALTVMSGTIDQRVRYIGLLINHLNYFVRAEKLSKDRPAILNTRQNLVDAFVFLVNNNVERFKLDEKRYGEITGNFKSRVIVLDASYATPEAQFGTQVVRELEGLQAARQHHFRAVQGYSEYLSGSAGGLTSATVEIENAMKIIMQVCYDNGLIEISEGEWRKAITSPPAPPQPETSKR